MKEAALRLGLPVYQPERVRRPEAVEYLRGLAPDAMVVVGYGQIIPQAVIDMAPLGIINVHASLLPKYRGAGPIQWAIVQRRDAHRRDHHADRCGAGYRRYAAEGGNGDRPGGECRRAGRRLAAMGADLLVETLDGPGGREDRAARSRTPRRPPTRRC